MRIILSLPSFPWPAACMIRLRHKILLLVQRVPQVWYMYKAVYRSTCKTDGRSWRGETRCDVTVTLLTCVVRFGKTFTNSKTWSYEPGPLIVWREVGHRCEYRMLVATFQRYVPSGNYWWQIDVNMSTPALPGWRGHILDPDFIGWSKQPLNCWTSLFMCGTIDAQHGGLRGRL